MFDLKPLKYNVIISLVGVSNPTANCEDYVIDGII